MPDREKIIKETEDGIAFAESRGFGGLANTMRDVLTLLKEQEKKEIKLHKKHVITLKRDDKFTMGKLCEAVCETLMDEGELVIDRMDDHKKVNFTFYVTHEDT